MTNYKDIKRIPIVAADVPNLDATKITTGTVNNARITLDAAEIPNLDTAKITTGTMADARISSSSVVQHSPAVDLTPVRNDIATLALKEAITANRVAYNLPSSHIQQFESDVGLLTQTDGDRVTSGEYWATVYSANIYTAVPVGTGMSTVTVDTGGWTGSITNDALRGTGGNSPYTAGYVDYLFDMSTDFEVKIFIVTDATGAQASGSYSWSTIGMIVTDTSVAAGASPAIFRHADTSAAAYHQMYDITPTEIGDGHITAAYASTIGSDSITFNGSSTNSALNVNCSSGNAFGNKYNNGLSGSHFGFHAVNDRSANTLTMYHRNNAAFTTEGGGVLTFSNTPATGRFMMFLGGGSNLLTTQSFAGSYATADSSNFSSVYGSVANATGTLISAAQTANASQTKVSGVILYKDNAGTATLNTDIKIYFSCDNGSNWTQSTMTAAGTFSAGILMAKAPEVTCTAGTSVKYKVEFANQAASSKETQLHGVGMNY